MESVSELILMQLDGLSEGPLLLVNPGEPELVTAIRNRWNSPVWTLGWDARLRTAVGGSNNAVSDLYSGLDGHDAHWGAHPGLPDLSEARVILEMPKAKERLAFLLEILESRSGLLPREINLVGAKRSGVESAAKALQRAGRQCTKITSARHSQWWTLRPQPARLPEPWNPWKTYQVDGLPVFSLPGVFSHGALDAGTAMLLTVLDQQLAARKTWQTNSGTRRVLDFGCGAGIISAWLLTHLGAAWHLDASDVDFLAVLSTRRTLEEQLAPASQAHICQVLWQDGLADCRETYDLIVTNPPFHQGQKQDLSITRRFLEDCRSRLRPGGELLLVANRFLPYAALIEETVAAPTILCEDNRFRVYSATAPQGRGR